MEQYDSRVDAYIGKSAEFAQPILRHLRELVHRVSPQITETMKWSAPFFEYKGILCHMMGFKQHCGFGFWKAELLPDPHRILQIGGGEAAGSVGRITSLADLPEDDILIWYIREAMDIKDMEAPKSPARKAIVPKPKPISINEPPQYLIDLLDQQPEAKAYFYKFSPSQQKEYITWFEDAKTDATRQKRLIEGLQWISEGKTRHWKYK